MLHIIIIIIIIIINHIYAGYLAVSYPKQPMFMYNIAAIMYRMYNLRTSNTVSHYERFVLLH
jgi:hypothetical protein